MATRAVSETPYELALRGVDPCAGVVGAIEGYQVVAWQHRWLYDLNQGQIRVLAWFLRAATVCLVVEVALWIRGARSGRVAAGR